MTLLFGSVNLGETGLAEAFLELDLTRIMQRREVSASVGGALW